jgi:hypothetical protein
MANEKQILIKMMGMRIKELISERDELQEDLSYLVRRTRSLSDKPSYFERKRSFRAKESVKRYCESLEVN